MSRLESELLNYKSKYTNNDVLINNLGLDDEESLNKAERMITSYKLAKLYLNSNNNNFDVEHYLSIHKFLFEDIYPFAGEIRSENIAKRIPFCLPNFIYQELDRTLKQANKKVSTIDSKDKLLVFITELYSDLDIIHPFREGNGRTEREFIRQFMDYICKKNNLEPYYLDYSLIKDRENYINAVVKADALLDYSDLLSLFNSILTVKTVSYNNLETKDKEK
jgi:cell filamentation protein